MEDEISKQMELLMGGYGFNYYRTENQMRADDLLVRQRAGGSFGHAADRLEQLAQEFQRTIIPAPSRQQPYPPTELMARLTALRALRHRVMNQSTMLASLPAPAQDKIWRRLRDEQGLLQQLLQADIAMLKLAAEVDHQIQSLSAEAWRSTDTGKQLTATLDQWDAAVRARGDLLQVQVRA